MNRLIKLLPLVALGAVTANAQVVIGAWYAFDDANGIAHTEAADSVATDWTANVATSDRGSRHVAAAQSATLDAGATGPVVDPGEGDVSGLQATVASPGNATTTFTFVNNSGADADLDHFYYDYKKAANVNGTSDTTDWGTIDLIAVSGVTGATNGSTLNSRAIGTANYFSQGVDIDLSAYSIADGTTATFTMVVTWDGTTAPDDPTWHKLVTYDNIALTAVPEPSTYAILAGFAALGLVMIRRRR
jgi:hypothetical protein